MLNVTPSSQSATSGSLQTPPSAPMDQKAFRGAMGSFATGVSVITTRDAGGPHGITVNSLTSVSLDPCLLLVCLKRGSITAAAIRQSGEFVVNLLAHDQGDLARRFAKSRDANGARDDRFDGTAYVYSDSGLPVLSDSLGHVCCTLDRVHESGDHDILIGQAHSCAQSAGEPLLFYRGGFGIYRPHAHG